MRQRGNTELPCRAPLSYWIPLRNGPSGSVIIENLHKYKLHRKQVGLLPEGDHQGRPLGHTTKRRALERMAAKVDSYVARVYGVATCEPGLARIVAGRSALLSPARIANPAI